MNLCADGHDEICYEGRTCPMCNLISEKDDKISSLESKINELQNVIDEASENE